MLGAVLDGDDPDVGSVGEDELAPPLKFRRFVQPRVALLLNQVRAIRDCLLQQLHNIGFGLVDPRDGLCAFLPRAKSAGRWRIGWWGFEGGNDANQVASPERLK